MKKLKIALIVPPTTNTSLAQMATDPPIGLASIAGYLESKSIDVEMIDAIAEKIGTNEILKRLEAQPADFVGISLNYCTYHNSALALSKEIKHAFPHAKIMIGGNHATALAEYILQAAGDVIDFIVRGEGEITTYEAIVASNNHCDMQHVEGISYKCGERVIQTRNRELIEELDELPLPAYHLLPMHSYQRYNVISARGCPFGCDFCASTVLFSKKVRYKSPQKVFEEIKLLFEKYGPRQVWFSDDTFTVNREHTEALLDYLIQSEMEIKWSCLTTVNTVQPYLLEKMKKAGCSYISYGVESGHAPFLSRYIKKPINREGIIATSRMTMEVGLPHYGFFIFGFPGESWESVYDTYDLIMKANFSGGGINILIPLPGTKIWRELIGSEKGFLVDEIQWESLFARGVNNLHSEYVAELASRWTVIKKEEILEACYVGEKLFPFSKYLHSKK